MGALSEAIGVVPPTWGVPDGESSAFHLVESPSVLPHSSSLIWYD